MRNLTVVNTHKGLFRSFVLVKMSEAGLLLKKENCSFMKESITYLGHVIDAHIVDIYT